MQARQKAILITTTIGPTRTRADNQIPRQEKGAAAVPWPQRMIANIDLQCKRLDFLRGRSDRVQR